MNGILTDMFAPSNTAMNGGMMNCMGNPYNAAVGNAVVDLPPSLHTLSINPQNAFHAPYYQQQWEYAQRCE